MNIFFLSFYPSLAAKYHCDQHCVKMILETAQLLYSVWWILNEKEIKRLCKAHGLTPYKLTHKNHPCAIWARTSYQNYLWLTLLGIELCKEYTKRYTKTHACKKHIYFLYSNSPTKSLFSISKFTTPALAMPDECKTKNNPIKSYRNYYVMKKSTFARWRHSPVPKWYIKRSVA